MSKYKDKTWNIIEDIMKESESLSDAIDRVDRLMIQGVISIAFGL